MAIPDPILRRLLEVAVIVACIAPLTTHRDRMHDRIGLDPAVAIAPARVVAPALERVFPIVCRNPIQDIGLVMGGTPIHAEYLLENVTDQPVWIEKRVALAGTLAPDIRCLEPFGSTILSHSMLAPTSHTGSFTKSISIQLIAEPSNAMEILAKNEWFATEAN